MFLARKFDEKVIWKFIKEKEGADDIESLSMELIATTGCNNENCERDYDGAEQFFFNLYDTAFDKKNNKFIDLTTLLGEEYDITREVLIELKGKGIEPLDYFQIYYCPSCKQIDYYIE